MEPCKNLDACHKIKMVEDKDMLESQFIESVIAVCKACDQNESKITKRSE